MVRGKALLLTRWLWLIDLVVAGAALIILVVGLLCLPGVGAAQSGTPTGLRQPTTDNPGKNNSLLVASAEKFHERWYPKPKPQPKIEPKIIEPPKIEVVQAPPKIETPPHVKPPDPIVPPPNFTLDCTMVFGQRYGVAFIKQPAEPAAKLVRLGETVENYKITRIGTGEMELKRDNKSFTLKVPAPNPAEIQAIAARTPAPVTPGMPGSPPGITRFGQRPNIPATNPGGTPPPVPTMPTGGPGTTSSRPIRSPVR